ncbi:hypothetical protein EDD53_1244 [Pacificibacter maritimus]|uniref:Sulfotransferase family protein n=1 Tax=Pacificibacter maritimus TaxID=762213 RepID=A0A3N4UX04_9RHOB|nr:hypothetical protein [Pacificibacter maritimus]RPE72101.1 hypothetical protein EDD53_1244 [Pacificibacter maritimus]
MKLSLHIGMGKTGTTALQSFLGESAVYLKQHRCFYLGRILGRIPDGPRPRNQSQAAQAATLRSALEALESHAATPEFRADFDLVVWSNEILATNPDPRDQIKTIAEFAASSNVFTNVEVVLVLRRQDDWLEAAYQQWGLMNKLKTGHQIPSPQDYAAQVAPILDYAHIYELWSAALPVTVLTYDDLMAKGGSVECFCDLWGVPRPDDIQKFRSVRSSAGPAISTLYSYFNRAFPARMKSEVFDKFIKKYQVKELSEADHICVPPDVRAAVLDKAATGNTRLAQALGRDALFAPAPDLPRRAYEQGQADAISALLRICKAQSAELDRLRERIIALENDKKNSRERAQKD